MAVHTAEELQHMTVKELRELAKELPGVTGIHSMKKDDLVALLSGGAAASPKAVARPAAQKSGLPGAGKKTLTKPEIKSLLVELRKAKEGAQAGKEKGRVEILRRRINRLKKQSRKVQPAA
ncbi:MAG: Rho termination factor N-terminal domain-containing protein [Thermodesulfobacteriota bacterium]